MKTYIDYVKRLQRKITRKHVAFLIAGLVVAFYAFRDVGSQPDPTAQTTSTGGVDFEVPDVVGEWDFSMMSQEERRAIYPGLFPQDINARLAQRETESQRQQREKTMFAIMDPVGYRQMYPKSSQELEAERESEPDPVRAAEMRESQMTAEQIAARDEARLAILHPEEYEAFVAPARSPEEQRAREQANENFSNRMSKLRWLRVFITNEAQLQLPAE